MANFFAPNGSRDGYEQIGDNGSVGLVRMFESTILEIGLSGGTGYAISSSVDSIASNIPAAEKSAPNGSRMLKLNAKNRGVCKLIAKTSDNQSVNLDIVVEPAPKSKKISGLTLLPAGLPSLSACRTWINEVDAAIELIAANPVGEIVLKNTRDAFIMPDLEDRTCNASSLTLTAGRTRDGRPVESRTIQFSPSICKGRGAGDRPDEMLCHELIHQLEDGFGRYSNAPDPANRPQVSLNFQDSDFMTITITNLYASVNHRPLRKDHVGFAELPQPYKSNEAKFFKDFRGNFVSFNDRLPDLYRAFIFVEVPWDPFQEIRP